MFDNSKKLFSTSQQITPGGVHSPVRNFNHVGSTPIYFKSGHGPYLKDVDGREYIDFCASFGPHLLGHSHPRVVAALKEQAELATSFGACHPKEIELCEKILKRFPFCSKIRLVNSGTESVMTAIRLARGFTGRSKIVKFDGCYHGHSDGLLSKAGSGVAELDESSSAGVPNSIVQETLTAKLDDLSSLRALFSSYGKEIAAIILEPVPANYGLWIPPRETLEEIQSLCRKNGALFIFDEVITGFRLAAGGASERFEMSPDIVTLGKIVGGGLPLAAIAGRAEVMDYLAPKGPVYQAGTLSGNPLAAAAGCAVMDVLTQESPYSDLERRTTQFCVSLEARLRKRYPKTQIRKIASIFWIALDEPTNGFPPVISTDAKRQYAELFRKAAENGIYLAPSPYEVGFVSAAHTDSVLEEALARFEKCL